MIPRPVALGLGIVLTILAVLWGVSEWRQRSGSAEEIRAHVANGEANVHQHNAEAQDPKVAKLEAIVARSKADMGRLTSERNALLRKLASIPKPGADPTVGDHVGSDPVEPSGNSGELELLRATVVKDAEVIESQAKIINSQSGVISELTISRDEWKATAEARERQALAQEAATRAWKQSVLGAEVKGGVKGAIAWEVLRRVLGVK